MIKELIDKYSVGITKLEMGRDLFLAERELFDYRFLLKNNICNRIIIEKEKVYAVFDIGGEEVALYLSEIDYSSVPAQLFLKGFYELDETAMFKQFLRYLDEEAVFFDVGANLGWYGLIAKKLKGKGTKVYSFEPVPETYERLKDNYYINRYGDECIFNAGLYKDNVKLDFYYDITESGASSLSDLKGKNTTKIISVDMIKLDDFVKNHNINRIDFIKCDVEGAELFVFEGGKDSINKFRPIVHSEMLRKWAAKQGYHPNDIINFFKEIGYDCYIIKDNKLAPFYVVTEETIETNYYFLDKEKHNNIVKDLVI